MLIWEIRTSITNPCWLPKSAAAQFCITLLPERRLLNASKV
ncbi:hypothetical protein Hanom_Chr00s000671g01654411 [Helianthus anomalus]